MLEKLNGKKTYIGSFLLSLIGAAWALDRLIHPANGWLPDSAYASACAFVGGLTGVAMRIGFAKSGQSPDA